MKKRYWLWIVASLMLVLSACGEKSKEDVVQSLQKKLEEMTGYKTEATMSLKTGDEEQKYKIDVWHKKKDYYRVLLNNEQDEKNSQIILKNEDGVYVLTPALNKSFKFQSDWPNNSSQPYLYNSLVADVVKDKDATFETTETYYVFETKTNYQNSKNLPYQEIYFDKKSLTPVMVKVLDKDRKPLVEVKFSSFELNPKFSDDAFTTEKNMTSGALGIPVMADGEPNEPAAFTVLYPEAVIGNTELDEQKEIDMENGKRVILSFKGEKSYTLIQESWTSYPASATVPVEVSGEMVDLGYTMGALSGSTLEWSHEGMNFYLASEDLTKEEMIEVAQSVQGTVVK
ncbi:MULTISPECIES: LolA family protein [Pontibacillus]|uniref:Outer membrane lipoprotein carrier protein LolA n=1 Tax=Pontibacillus chungwhensis TaxID=265426 RepID=A0ABY8V180_9BACI|nr:MULTISPECIES: outer membrane lipoprotein carrier protein LolA [Pontibacillus]MCD5325849.1 outer membrane lipoprotein carrier protein LolA [Pontibacillus sp. HN14]WIF98379.1 outer membrane lipoprotein carrier protein LolA [Pontibacillus chungwhensis]